MDDILNVLVVEDEAPIREDLSLFPWEECGALLIGEAASGREALEICEEAMPDIIVTDVTMPEIDGLALMERVKRLSSATQFVLLSCHADFSYVQKALRLGAVDYVVKAGFQESDLKSAIHKARERLHAGRHTRQSLWRESYWRRTAETREFLGGGTVPGYSTELPARLITLHCAAQRTDAIFVSRFCLKELERSAGGEWFGSVGNRYSRLVADSALAKATLLQLLDAVRIGVEKLAYLTGDVRFFGSISSVVETTGDLKSALEYLDAYHDHVFYEERSIVVSGPVPPAHDASDSLWDALEIELQGVERSSDSLAAYLKNDFLVWARHARIKPDQLRSMLMSRREAWKHLFDIRGTDDAFWTRLSGVATLSGLSRLLVREIESSQEDVGTDRRLRSEVRHARRIIKSEYATPLTLEGVAQRIGWSASHLSRVFGHEVGRTFKECLTETRVAKAMELLRSPGAKVYEVAERTGFPSYRQFSSVFKGITGVRPKDYQKGGYEEP